MSALATVDSAIYNLIQQEAERQKEGIELIASENFTSQAVVEAVGSVLTNKYAEGYPGKRYYGGCEYHDQIEQIAIDRVKQLFGAEHANVQAHSGASANLAAYMAAVNLGDTALAMRLDHGGHLTHGHKANFSGKFYNIVAYGVKEDTCQIDYNEVERLALEHKPKMIIAGASAYSRFIDFERFGHIAKKVEAVLMVDMAHIAGLVAAKLHPSPVPYADIVTSTTHKTLRGPRAGLILCKAAFAKKIDSAIFPGSQGGPLMHTIAAKAVCFKEALESSFVDYQKKVLENAQALASCMHDLGYPILTGGTDNHLFMIDLRGKNISGAEVESTLNKAGIVVNKNMIPYDTASPMVTSGIRIGTPAVTTRGMGISEMKVVAALIDEAIKNRADDDNLQKVKNKAMQLVSKFPIPNMN